MFFCGNLLLLEKWFLCYVPQKATLTGFNHVKSVKFYHTFSPRVHLKQNLTPCIYSQAVMATNCHSKHKATHFPCTCKLISLMFFTPIISLTHIECLWQGSGNGDSYNTHCILPFSLTSIILPYMLSFPHTPWFIRFTMFECPAAGCHHYRKIVSSIIEFLNHLQAFLFRLHNNSTPALLH